MMSLWDALRMNMMISYQELVRTFPNSGGRSGRIRDLILQLSKSPIYSTKPLAASPNKCIFVGE
ncbi:hypothetical protein [Klebsiella quasipneumoniae]|uniref:hypothetical protein n=1 Tax=Klebsiella quasipneumoniae TaxID=1463165 RepID=UPI0007D6DC3E|nr:hypothetical protein [Klebsiella quasipneumoniae]HBX5445296.1 hypothetical protein [Klebsiella pneumoniae]